MAVRLSSKPGLHEAEETETTESDDFRELHSNTSSSLSISSLSTPSLSPSSIITPNPSDSITRLAAEDSKYAPSLCLTLPHGEDLDQVFLGIGGIRIVFEKAYRVGGLIGRGGFGSVYSGVRLRDQKLVAIKHVARDKIRLWCSAHGKSVPKEICLMRHAHGVQNVIRLLDFYERPDSFILILSRPSSYKDLFDFISEKGSSGLEENLTHRFFLQVLGAVRNLSERNVVHRDIKDENILVNLKTHNLAIIDFGSGCHQSCQPLGEFEGTQLYSPPEWLETGQYRAEDATVWSLGILLYVMLTGDVPFHSQQQICSGELTFRKTLSPLAKLLVRDCLTHNPRLRPSLAQVAQKAWVTQQPEPSSWIQCRPSYQPPSPRLPH